MNYLDKKETNFLAKSIFSGNAFFNAQIFANLASAIFKDQNEIHRDFKQICNKIDYKMAGTI